MLKAVTFDLWNTVIREKSKNNIEGVVNTRLSNVLFQHNVRLSLKEIENVTTRCRNKVMMLQVKEGKEMPPDAQITWILDELNVTATDGLVADLYEAYTTSTLEEMPEPVPGVALVLAELRDSFDIALICNTGRTPGTVARQILERLRLKQHFSHLIFSDEIGVAKPNPKIFHEALTALGVRPEEAVHIGDDPRTDVKGARNIGMKAAWLPRGGQVTDVECDVIVHNWKDFLTWVKERV